MLKHTKRVFEYQNQLEMIERERDDLEMEINILKNEKQKEKELTVSNNDNNCLDNNDSLLKKIKLLQVENIELAAALEHLKAEASRMNTQSKVQ